MMDNESIFGIPGETIPCDEISDPKVFTQTPVVSVHMITYNHEAYIAQAIEGVLQQKTGFPFELIIGEDCSTDRTRKIVLEYQKKNPAIIRVLISAKNVGGHKNARRVYGACRGKYIAYCEGDDFWHHPLKLEMQVDYLESHPDVGLIHSDVVWHVVETGKKVPSYYRHKNLLHDHDNILISLIQSAYHVTTCSAYHIMTCSAVAPKKLLSEIYQQCQYEFSDKFLMGDLQTWIELAYRSKVKYIDEPLATYNELPESACRSKDINKNIRLIKNGVELRIHYANKYGGNSSKEIAKPLIRGWIRYLLPIAYYCRKPELAQEAIHDARQYQVPFDLTSHLYIFGSKNKIFFYLARFLFFALRVCKRMLRSFCVVKYKSNP